MGKSQRDKGMRTEREFLKILSRVDESAERVPLSGALGGKYSGDVKALGLTFECKARKDGFKQLYTWLENRDALALKADRKQWLVVLPIDTFLNLIGKGE